MIGPDHPSLRVARQCELVALVSSAPTAVVQCCGDPVIRGIAMRFVISRALEHRAFMVRPP